LHNSSHAPNRLGVSGKLFFGFYSSRNLMKKKIKVVPCAFAPFASRYAVPIAFTIVDPV
jgi:hypothetical protein